MPVWFLILSLKKKTFDTVLDTVAASGCHFPSAPLRFSRSYRYVWAPRAWLVWSSEMSDQVLLFLQYGMAQNLCDDHRNGNTSTLLIGKEDRTSACCSNTSTDGFRRVGLLSHATVLKISALLSSQSLTRRPLRPERLFSQSRGAYKLNGCHFYPWARAQPTRVKKMLPENG